MKPVNTEPRLGGVKRTSFSMHPWGRSPHDVVSFFGLKRGLNEVKNHTGPLKYLPITAEENT